MHTKKFYAGEIDESLEDYQEITFFLIQIVKGLMIK